MSGFAIERATDPLIEVSIISQFTRVSVSPSLTYLSQRLGQALVIGSFNTGVTWYKAKKVQPYFWLVGEGWEKIYHSGKFHKIGGFHKVVYNHDRNHCFTCCRWQDVQSKKVMTTLSSGSNHLRSRQSEKWADLNETETGHLRAWNSKQPVLNGWKWWFPEITNSHIKIYTDLVHHQIDSQPLKNAWLSGSRCFFSKQQTHGLTWQLLQAWNSSRPTCVDAQKTSQAFRNGFFGRVGKKHGWANDLRLNKKINKKRPFQTSFFFSTKRTPLWGEIFFVEW